MADSIELPALPLQAILPSYLYQEYRDDEDLQAFINAQNLLAQTYLSWFNNNPLALYTNPNISGPLLDWIALGIYGLKRPVFAATITSYYAGIDSQPLNAEGINSPEYTSSGTPLPADDDTFKRIITWWVYAGYPDRHFSTMLLRKRVARFLFGPDGTDVDLDATEVVHIQAGAFIPPPAPTLSSVAGGNLASLNGAINDYEMNAVEVDGAVPGPITYYARDTYVSPIGETLAGPQSFLSVPPDFLLVSQSPPPFNGAIGWNAYVGILGTQPRVLAGINADEMNAVAVNGNEVTEFDFETKQNGSTLPIGTDWTEPTTGLIDGSPLPSADTANIEGNFIILIPPGLSASIFKEAFDQGYLSFPFQLTATVVIE